MLTMDGTRLDAKNADEALDAIYEEAEKLLQMDDLSAEIEAGLDRIMALARYKMDI